jgi:hypothetical protein
MSVLSTDSLQLAGLLLLLSLLLMANMASMASSMASASMHQPSCHSAMPSTSASLVAASLLVLLRPLPYVFILHALLGEPLYLRQHPVLPPSLNWPPSPPATSLPLRNLLKVHYFLRPFFRSSSSSLSILFLHYTFIFIEIFMLSISVSMNSVNSSLTPFSQFE